ncbi:MAG: PEP-CTERM sorting domain-containing protein [Phycisphaerae bacterium]|nr:PEP-CTERM sorting domain-containing protein [Phycisphaerae bacterium]
MTKISLQFIFVLLLSVVVSAPAATIYNQWNGSVSTDWNTAANWDAGFVPFSFDGVDKTKAGFKTATGAVLGVETQNAEAWNVMIGGSGGVGELTIDGGRLTTGDYIIMGNVAAESGTLYVNSGEMNLGGHLYVGFHGAGTVYMTGGSINILGASKYFGIAEYSEEASVGTVYLHGGTITAANFRMENGGSLATGLLEIGNDGKLVIFGDSVDKVNGYIGNGLIAGLGGAAVQVDYDVTTPGMTTVYVPEPATMLMFGLGSLILYRRK